jgi:hypothetical protein
VNLNINEKKVLDYVRQDPGCSKADIVRHLEKTGLASRITVLKYIENLETESMIICKLEKPNSQIFRIYINEANKLVAVLGELDEFKDAYSRLLDKSKDRIHTKDYANVSKKLGINESNPSKWQESDVSRFFEFAIQQQGTHSKEMGEINRRISDLTEKANQIIDVIEKARPNYAKINTKQTLLNLRLEMMRAKSEMSGIISHLSDFRDFDIFLLVGGAIRLFYEVKDAIFFRSTMIWPLKISDREILLNLYSTTYTKMAEIQMKLIEFLKSIKVKYFSDPLRYIAGFRESFTNDLSLEITCYWTSNMKAEIKAVLESLLKLNKEIEGINYPGFHSNEPRELLRSYETEKQLTCALKSIDHALERFSN